MLHLDRSCSFTRHKPFPRRHILIMVLAFVLCWGSKRSQATAPNFPKLLQNEPLTAANNWWSQSYPSFASGGFISLSNRYLLDTRTPLYDFSWSADVLLFRGREASGAGLVFRAGPKHLFYFLIDGWGRYAVIEHQNGRITFIQDWTSTAGLIEPYKTTRMRVEVYRERNILYLQNREIFQFSDYDIGRGHVGIVAQEQLTAFFDNFLLRTPQPQQKATERALISRPSWEVTTPLLKRLGPWQLKKERQDDFLSRPEYLVGNNDWKIRYSHISPRQETAELLLPAPITAQTVLQVKFKIPANSHGRAGLYIGSKDPVQLTLDDLGVANIRQQAAAKDQLLPLHNSPAGAAVTIEVMTDSQLLYLFANGAFAATYPRPAGELSVRLWAEGRKTLIDNVSYYLKPPLTASPADYLAPEHKYRYPDLLETEAPLLNTWQTRNGFSDQGRFVFSDPSQAFLRATTERFGGKFLLQTEVQFGTGSDLALCGLILGVSSEHAAGLAFLVNKQGKVTLSRYSGDSWQSLWSGVLTSPPKARIKLAILKGEQQVTLYANQKPLVTLAEQITDGQIGVISLGGAKISFDRTALLRARPPHPSYAARRTHSKTALPTALRAPAEYQRYELIFDSTYLSTNETATQGFERSWQIPAGSALFWEADLTSLAGSQTNAGLAISNNGHQICAEIDNWGRYRIFSIDSGRLQIIRNWTKSPLNIRPGYNNLRLLGTEKMLAFYVNYRVIYSQGGPGPIDQVSAWSKGPVSWQRLRALRPKFQDALQKLLPPRNASYQKRAELATATATTDLTAASFAWFSLVGVAANPNQDYKARRRYLIREELWPELARDAYQAFREEHRPAALTDLALALEKLSWQEDAIFVLRLTLGQAPDYQPAALALERLIQGTTPEPLPATEHARTLNLADNAGILATLLSGGQSPSGSPDWQSMLADLQNGNYQQLLENSRKTLPQSDIANKNKLQGLLEAFSYDRMSNDGKIDPARKQQLIKLRNLGLNQALGWSYDSTISNILQSPSGTKANPKMQQILEQALKGLLNNY